jgi:hypothetical protein
MSDRPLTKSANAESRKESSRREQPSRKEPQSFPHGWKASQWPTYAALAIAVIAAVLAALAYFHPAHNRASVPQQGGDAKANVCSAFTSTRKAVVINTHMQSSNPNDQTAQLSVATNARLALIGGGAYLRERLAANTAAPADLANAANSLANTIEQLGINYLTGAGNDVQDPVRKDLNSEITQIDKLCAPN